jgi:uncharacterized protein (DUF4415 family)
MKKDELPSMEEQVKALENIKDEDIDLSDIPEICDFSGFKRGIFYRPVKQPVTLRLDADILAWFKKKYPKYQTAINSALRQYVHTQS